MCVARVAPLNPQPPPPPPRWRPHLQPPPLRRHPEQVAGKKADIKLIKRFPIAPKAGYVVAAESAHGLPAIIGPQAYDDMIG